MKKAESGDVGISHQEGLRYLVRRPTWEGGMTLDDWVTCIVRGTRDPSRKRP
ncbi:MAG: hypothetical protein FJ087_02835 [Deltaproteobacteria bacterium]|nr:hypothetical protein [Deltaproteobacteria bacterium]